MRKQLLASNIWHIMCTLTKQTQNTLLQQESIGQSLRPNKKISVFWVTVLKIFSRVGTHIFFSFHFFF